jgi:hypothetical protein
MNLDPTCRNAHAPWSVVIASQSSAALAGLLAGFTLTAIAFLLGRQRKEDRIFHAVALFAPGVLVLVLACNQFIGIWALAPPQNDPHVAEVVCSLAWTQSMAASGMLAVGFVVTVAGLGWIIAHIVDADAGFGAREAANQDRRSLVHLGNFLVFVAIVTVSLLLTRTSLNYFTVMEDFGLHGPKRFNGAVWSVFGLMAVASGLIILVRTVSYYRQRKQIFRGRDLIKESNAARWFRRAFVICVVVLTAGMALVGPLYSGVVAQNSAVPGELAAYFGLGLCLILPCVIFLFISASLPGPDFWHWIKPGEADEDSGATQQNLRNTTPPRRPAPAAAVGAPVAPTGGRPAPRSAPARARPDGSGASPPTGRPPW